MTQTRNISELERINSLHSSWEFAFNTYTNKIPKLSDLGSLPFNETIREEMMKEMERTLTDIHNKLAEYGFDTGWKGATSK